MPYSIAVSPAIVDVDGAATVTVGVPDAVDTTHDVNLVRKADGVVVGTASITIDLDPATVGLVGDDTDLYVQVDGPFQLSQTGPATFSLVYVP